MQDLGVEMDRFEAKMKHVETKIGRFEAKHVHFEAKRTHFQTKMKPLGAYICLFEAKAIFLTHFDKTKAVFFLMNSLCGLKADGPFSAKSWPGGGPLEAQICNCEPANHHFEGTMKHFGAKRMHFAAKMMHF